ncbi:hypothetical protein DAT35_04475 [Vitiosangium sp. GDMCC 1.1324]|nr:hypothetical protein DAT35_04475 [Vitiosangium sp. GDMCC 1.1324]
MLTLVGLWSFALQNPALDTRTFLQDGPKRQELAPAFSSVLDELSLRFDEFRGLDVFPVAQEYTGKARACAFFSRWPLIRLNDHQFIVAAHPFLKIQVATKSITKALALAREDEGGGSTMYSRWMGGRLELFFGELCELWRPSGHFGEYEYLAKGSEKSPDRIIFEQHGSKNVACLFQLKLKMLSEATHFGAKDESIRKDLASAFSETIYKTVKFLVRAETAVANGQLREDNADLTRRILKCDRFCLVGIVPDMPSVFTFGDLRSMLLTEVKANLNASEREWFDRHFSSRCVWHIMDLHEFEFFLSIPARERELYKRLLAYFRDADVNGPFIRDEKLPTNFRTYLIRRYGRPAPATERHRIDSYVPELFSIFAGTIEDVSRYFALKPLPSTQVDAEST